MTLSTPARLAGFLLGLAAVFVAARGVGAATSPIAHPIPAMTHGSPAAGEVPASDQGYTLRVLSTPTDRRPLRFVVDHPDGSVVQVYDIVDEQPLHLVVVGPDDSGHQRVHPELSDDGVWSIDLDLAPGRTRLIAEFTPREGPALVLGTSVEVTSGDEATVGEGDRER